MDIASQLKRGISRQFSTGSLRRSGRFSFKRQNSLDPKRNNFRFSFGRQSSLDPIRRSSVEDDGPTVPGNLDSTMQLLFLACKGDVKGVQELLDEGVDVNSIDLDGRTALHISSCEGHVEVVNLLLSRRANIDARDRWGSTLRDILVLAGVGRMRFAVANPRVASTEETIYVSAADAKYYGNVEVYNILKARGARIPKTRKTPMTVANPREVPEYELNPLDIQIRRSDGISKGSYQIAKWNGTKVSVKILDKDTYLDPESINAFKHELTLLEKVRHPNVVQFVGAVTQEVPMMIVLEYHARGDLSGYLQKKGRLSPSKALRFGIEIARGMNCLHECKPEPIIHCGLEPKNILLDCGGQLKVAGFGVVRLSTFSPDKAKLAQPEAVDRTNPYVAPEIYRDEIFDKSVDVYSFGIMLYEMIEGALPFSSKDPEEATKLLCLEAGRPAIKSKSKYPSDLKELIEQCWHPDSAMRPAFSDIIVRLDKIITNGSKHGWWKDTFKFPWK